jgi:hypothetical protein
MLSVPAVASAQDSTIPDDGAGVSSTPPVPLPGEPARRKSYHEFLKAGMPPGYAAGDGAALHFCGESLARVVSSRPKAGAFWVEEAGGELSEVALPVGWLGESRALSAA